MSQQTTAQRSGAQQTAAGKVRAKEGEFQATLNTLLGHSQALRPKYKGPGADAFFVLVSGWLEDAEAIVKDMENFAEKLVSQDTKTNQSQEESQSKFTNAAARLSTTKA